MARHLIIDWDHGLLHVLSASVTRGAVKVHGAVVREEASSPNLAEAETLGKRLRELLKTEGIAAAPAIFSVGRDRVILKDIRFPAVPPAEEPAVVRFQAVKELSHAPDEVVIDYHTSSDVGPNGERQALVVILRKEMLAAYQALCKAAGLKLAGVSLRPLGSALALPRSGTEPGDAAAVVTVTDRWAEFVVVRNGELILSRGLTAQPAGGETALMNEIRRNLAVYAAQSPKFPLKALFLAAGGSRAGLRGPLRNALSLPVHELDPLDGQPQINLPPEKRAGFVGAVGLLTAADRRALPLNFLAPKEPKPQTDANQWRIAAAAVLFGIAILGGAGYGYSRLAARDRTLQLLSLKKVAVDGELALAEEDARRIKALGDWADTEVVWLDELYDLTDRFPAGNEMRITQLAADPLNSRNVKDKHIARLSIKGIATDDHKPVDRLIQDLVEDGYYRVEPKKMGRNTGVDRRLFTQEFSTLVDIEKRPPGQYFRELDVEPPERPERNGRGGQGAGMGFGFEGGLP